jgi:glutamyl-tRNA reductase
MADAHRRAAAPVITGLRRNLEEPKAAELERLFKKLPDLDERARAEITQFADRLVNKLLHPPLESLKDASQDGPPQGLLDAIKRLFRLED